MPDSDGGSDEADGLSVLLASSWSQEVVHQLVLKVLFEETPLAAVLGIWQGADEPRVWYEPYRGLFDLALGNDAPGVLIELKVGADVGEDQRRRQRERAVTDGSPIVYLLLGASYFAAPNEPNVRNIGSPELARAIQRALAGLAGGVASLGQSYAARLATDGLAWTEAHDPASTSGFSLFRLYADVAASWPVTVRPYKVPHPGGTDWILNANAWTTVGHPAWEPASFYWEIVNGKTRFKLRWTGSLALRHAARDAYRAALKHAASERGETVVNAGRIGTHMTGVELTEDLRALVLRDGRVAPERARALWDRATALFLRALQLLPEQLA